MYITKMEHLQDKIFGRYDIRGLYPDEIDEGVVDSVADVLAREVFKKGKIVLGRDGRNSSPDLYEAAKRALERFESIEVVDAGLMTTPMLYFLVNDLETSGGIMITASHDAKERNGIKAVRRGEGESGFISGDEIKDMLEKR